MRIVLISTTCLFALHAAALAQAVPTAKASFVDAQGKSIGSAMLTQTMDGVLITLDLNGMPPGEHAFHVHAIGQCDPAAKFESAGDHFAPDGNDHGHSAEGGPHAGDMPNQFVGADGRLQAHVINSNVSLGTGETSLLDQDGSALVLHANPDDYRSQPSGNAGDRIACAVIE